MLSISLGKLGEWPRTILQIKLITHHDALVILFCPTRGIWREIWRHWFDSCWSVWSMLPPLLHNQKPQLTKGLQERLVLQKVCNTSELNHTLICFLFFDEKIRVWFMFIRRRHWYPADVCPRCIDVVSE